MIEITEILGRSEQGRTRPFICKASDGETYYVKGRSAATSGLVREWMGANLAQAFGLNIPYFAIVALHSGLVNLYGGETVTDLGVGYAFASRRILAAVELKYQLVNKVPNAVQKDILLFDFWAQNEDRTLTHLGGNPNMLWGNGMVHPIDHNLIFDDSFSRSEFMRTHAFHQVVEGLQSDWVERELYQQRLSAAAQAWGKAWGDMPDEWQENAGLDGDATQKRLVAEAAGEIWRRLIP